MSAALVVTAIIAAQFSVHPVDGRAVHLSRRNGIRVEVAGPSDPFYALAGAIPALDLKLAENGDFTDAISGDDLVTFSRSAASSPGTYVGSDGLIKTAAVNNILYSEQFNAGWTASFSTVSPDAAVSPDGKTTADKLVATSTFSISGNRIYQTASGNTLSIYAKKAEADEVLIRSAGGTVTTSYITFSLNDGSATSISGTGHNAYGSEDVGNGWFRLWVTSNSGYTLAYFAVAGASCANGNGIYIWGAQLEESSVVSPYIPTTSQTLAAARFDHDPVTGESLGLLVEEARTNLYLSSDPRITSGWITAATFSSNTTTAPDGTSINSVTNAPRASNVVIDAVPKTISFFVKADTATSGSFQTVGTAWGAEAGTYAFDLSAETFSGGEVMGFGNGWYRLSKTFSAGASLQTYGSNFKCTGLFLFGVQIEQGTFPSSYIPTTSAAMTRAADIATIEGADFASWYNATDGTVYGEFDRKNPNASPVQVLFHFAGTVGRFALYEHQPALAASGFYNLGVSACPVGTFCKHSGAFSGGGSGTESSAFDGVVVAADAGTVNPDVNKLYIGSRPTGQQLNGHIKRLTYWNTRLPDANLGAITQ